MSVAAITGNRNTPSNTEAFEMKQPGDLPDRAVDDTRPPKTARIPLNAAPLLFMFRFCSGLPGQPQSCLFRYACADAPVRNQVG